MPKYDKPLPLVSHESHAFWEGAKQHKFLVQRCKACGKTQFYPRGICKECWSDNLEWVQLTGRGTVYSYTIVYRAPLSAFNSDVPYALAIVDLEGGIRIITQLTGYKPEDLRIGMSGAIVFDDVTDEVTLVKFRPS